ncbi:MAG: nitroreductase family protein [Anaerolineaceae bacterium]|jgi:nitroreductase
MIKELVKKNRSYRRFKGNIPIDRETLVELVDLARFVASARNLQPLRYFVSCDAQTNAMIFPCLTWPVYGDWTQPSDEEKPAGYILLLGDTTIHTSIGIDTGIAAQTILLGAVELGLGGCIIGTIQHTPLRTALKIPDRYRILVIIALGTPGEKVVIEERESSDESTAFWRDTDGVHHVCKRKLKDILLGE